MPDTDLRADVPVCPDCGHANGGHYWNPLRRFALRRGWPVRRISCGSTQWYEDDETFPCDCRAPIHSA